MIDITQPVVTRDGDPATFLCNDGHRIYPLTYTVAGKPRSYTKEGRYNMCGPNALDIMNLSDYAPVSLQLPLFQDACA